MAAYSPKILSSQIFKQIISDDKIYIFPVSIKIMQNVRIYAAIKPVFQLCLDHQDKLATEKLFVAPSPVGHSLSKSITAKNK